MGKKHVLIDTNILINALRQDKQTLLILDKIGYPNIYVSVITVAEILFGVRKREENITRSILSNLNKVHIDEHISRRFVSIISDLRNKRRQIPDALIAATTIEYGFELYTLNKKDFDLLEGIRFFKPV